METINASTKVSNPSNWVPESESNANNSLSTPNIEVFFTSPNYPDKPSYHTGGLADQLSKAVDGAQKTVDIAVFELNLEVVVEALIRAKDRGVTVRLVTDSDYITEDSYKRLKKANIKVVEDKRDAFMHNKFAVIDKDWVWTGSWNFTDNCTYRNNNNSIHIKSIELGQNYTQEFEEMFVNNQFEQDSIADTPNPIVEVDGIQIENYFSPEDDVLSHILSVLEGAEHSIRFLAFSFTEDSISKVMIKKKKAGLVVEGVFESRNVTGTGSEFATLSKGKVDVMEDGNPYLMHHKVIIIDDSIVITGSYNFSVNAQKENNENILIIYSPEITAQYLEEFTHIQQQAREKQKSQTPQSSNEWWVRGFFFIQRFFAA